MINGSGKTGKDNFANFFIKHYDKKALNLSTIDKVKKIALKDFGWNGKKTEPARKFLSEIKRVWAEFNNGPFEDMVKQIEAHYNKLNKKNKQSIIYFIHCREPKEIQKFKDKYGDECFTLLIKRDDRKVPDNDSDKNVNDYNYDKIVQNNGNKIDLELEAVKFVEEMREMIKNKNKL